MKEMMTTEMSVRYKKYGDCLLAQKWLKLLLETKTHTNVVTFTRLSLPFPVTATCSVRGTVK